MDLVARILERVYICFGMLFDDGIVTYFGGSRERGEAGLEPREPLGPLLVVPAEGPCARLGARTGTRTRTRTRTRTGSADGERGPRRRGRSAQGKAGEGEAGGHGRESSAGR